VIPNQLVEVRIDKYGEHYKKLGYTFKHTKCWLRVPPWHLPKNSNKKVIAICDECSVGFKRNWQTISMNQSGLHLCKPCSKTRRTNAVSGWLADKSPNWNPETVDMVRYTNRVHYLSDKTYLQHKSEINPNNYPRTRNGIDGGYQLDHIVSINYGFENKIPPEKMAEKENLQMLTWQENYIRRDTNQIAFRKYVNEVNKHTKKTYKKYHQEINPYNYPRTLCGMESGYQLDHIISMREGFDSGLTPEYLARKENLQMLTWQENNKKRNK
jgi:hypothetical protein